VICVSQFDSLLRPLSFLLCSIFLPLFVRILARKPCFRFRLRRELRFIVLRGPHSAAEAEKPRAVAAVIGVNGNVRAGTRIETGRGAARMPLRSVVGRRNGTEVSVRIWLCEGK